MDPFSSANVVLRGLEVNVQEFEINKRKPTDLMQGKVPAQFYFSQLLLPSSVGDLWMSWMTISISNMWWLVWDQ